MAIASGHVQIRTRDGSKSITVPMGDGAAILTGGGGWTLEERWGLKPVTLWKAPEPMRQVFPVLMDQGDNSLEARIATMWSFALPEGARESPPLIRIDGPAVERTDLTWVVESLVPAEGASRREGDGDRIRQGFTVSLLEHVEVNTLVERSPAKKARRKAKGKRGKGLVGSVGRTRAGLTQTHVLRAGETLAQISAMFYGTPSRWQAIATLNKINDPNNPGPAGRLIRLP